MEPARGESRAVTGIQPKEKQLNTEFNRSQKKYHLDLDCRGSAALGTEPSAEDLRVKPGGSVCTAGAGPVGRSHVWKMHSWTRTICRRDYRTTGRPVPQDVCGIRAVNFIFFYTSRRSLFTFPAASDSCTTDDSDFNEQQVYFGR